MKLKDYLTTTNILTRPEEFQLFDCNGSRIELKYLKHFFQSEVLEVKVSDDKRHIDVTICDEILVFELFAMKEKEENTLSFSVVDFVHRPCITGYDWENFNQYFREKLKAENTDYDIIVCDRKSFESLSKLK